MPNTREKLIELLAKAEDEYLEVASTMPIREIREFLADIGCYGFYADHLIANGVTVQEWISVKDRLPEVIDSYIVVVKSKATWEKEYSYDVDVATYNPYEKAYIDDCWNTYIDWDEGQEFIHITHWMPLPQPPKGE